jgi:hypothetical protein
MSPLRPCLAALVALATCVLDAPAQAAGGVSPDTHEIVLQPGQEGEVTFRVLLPPSPPTLEPLDVLFMLDGTSSMAGEIRDFQSSIDAIIGDISRRSTNMRIAVAQFGDHPDLVPPRSPFASRRMPVWHVFNDLTGDVGVVKTSVRSLGIHWDGGDIQEAYLEALSRALELNWRPEAVRFVVVLGDAPARSPDRGPDGLIGTSDDLTFESVAAAYRRAGIAVAAVYALPSDERDREIVAGSFERLANPAQGGMAIPLSEGRSLAQAIERAIVRPVPPPPPPAMRPLHGAFSSWLSEPDRRTLGEQGRLHSFSFPIRVAEGTKTGIYEIDVEALAGPDARGPMVGSGKIIVKTGLRFQPIGDIGRGLVAALALLGLSLIAWRRLRGLWSLRHRGRALREFAVTLTIVGCVIATGILAFLAMPEDLDSADKWLARAHDRLTALATASTDDLSRFSDRLSGLVPENR